jgi:cell division protein FtsQ
MIDVEPTATDDRRLRPALRGSGGGFAGLGRSVWIARLPLFPIQEVVTQRTAEVRRTIWRSALAGRLRGNFFSVNLEGIRQAVEQLPWVRTAEARRQWPSRIEISIEEHQPVAYWGESDGAAGEQPRRSLHRDDDRAAAAPMPMLFGPNELALDMLGYYQQAAEMLQAARARAAHADVSPRLAVQLKLDDGMVVELGRQQPKAPVRERLLRFVEFYPNVLTAARQRPTVVDMRYPNGFALRVAAAPVIESKGKP